MEKYCRFRVLCRVIAGQNEENKSILIHMSQIPDWPRSLVLVNL